MFHVPLEQNCVSPTGHFYKLLYELIVLIIRSLGRISALCCPLLLRHVYDSLINLPDRCCLTALLSVYLCHSSRVQTPGPGARFLFLFLFLVRLKWLTSNNAALFQSGTGISCGCPGLTKGIEKEGETRISLIPWSELRGFILSVATAKCLSKALQFNLVATGRIWIMVHTRRKKRLRSNWMCDIELANGHWLVAKRIRVIK